MRLASLQVEHIEVLLLATAVVRAESSGRSEARKWIHALRFLVEANHQKLILLRATLAYVLFLTIFFQFLGLWRFLEVFLVLIAIIPLDLGGFAPRNKVRRLSTRVIVIQLRIFADLLSFGSCLWAAVFRMLFKLLLIVFR